MKHIKSFELSKIDMGKEISNEEKHKYTKDIESLYLNAMEYFTTIFPVSYEEGFTDMEADLTRDKFGDVFLNTKEQPIIITIDSKKYNDDIQKRIIKFFNESDIHYKFFYDSLKITFTFYLSIEQAEKYEKFYKYNL